MGLHSNAAGVLGHVNAVVGELESGDPERTPLGGVLELEPGEREGRLSMPFVDSMGDQGHVVSAVELENDISAMRGSFMSSWMGWSGGTAIWCQGGSLRPFSP